MVLVTKSSTSGISASELHRALVASPIIVTVVNFVEHDTVTTIYDIDFVSAISGAEDTEIDAIILGIETGDPPMPTLELFLGKEVEDDALVNADILKYNSTLDVWEKVPDVDTNDHVNLSSIGVNSHAVIDSHLSSTSNPHSVTKAQVGLTDVTNVNWEVTGGEVIHASRYTDTGDTNDHVNLSSIGVNSHAVIDSHLSSTSNPHSVTKAQVGLTDVTNVNWEVTGGEVIHASRYTDTGDTNDHVNLSSIGVNSHAVIDSHLSSTSNPHSVTKAQLGLTNVIDTLNKIDATTAPVSTDDSGSGYSVGSTWVNVTSDKAYVCVDSTATSAVWVETTVGLKSLSHGSLFWEGNATVTDVSIAGLADYSGTNMVKVSGTSTAGSLTDFSHASNKLTYDGASTKSFLVTVNTAVTNNKGERGTFLAIFKNGSEHRTIQAKSDMADATSIGLNSVLSLATNDYIELYTGITTNSMDDLTIVDLEMAISET